jgi:hypothetical protein
MRYRLRLDKSRAKAIAAIAAVAQALASEIDTAKGIRQSHDRKAERDLRRPWQWASPIRSSQLIAYR